MKNIRTIVITLILLAALPLVVQAMSHGDGSTSDMDHKKMDHEGMSSKAMDGDSMDHSKMDHGSMNMQGDMIMLGDTDEDGVKAEAHLKDVKAAMAKMGMGTTHHFMVMFVDDASGKPIDSGAAAVKIKGPDGKEGAAVKLRGMQGHFGADVELTEPGEYHFIVGTKLADGKKRQFEFEYTLK